MARDDSVSLGISYSIISSVARWLWREAELESDPNPVGLFVLAHLLCGGPHNEVLCGVRRYVV